MGKIVGLAFVAALNPALLAAAAVMLLFPRPQRLMLGYWLGSMFTSVTLGLVIVFALKGSSFEHTSKKTAHPALVLTLAGILLVVVLVLATGLDTSIAERRARRQAAKSRQEEKTPKTPMWKRELSKGSAAASFVVGVLLSFPGGAYLAALDAIGRQHYATAVTVLVVIAVCLVQLILLEVPIIAFWIWPQKTPAAVNGAKSWAAAHGRILAIWGLLVVAVGLAAIGINELVR
jgi:hypothetical protein